MAAHEQHNEGKAERLGHAPGSHGCSRFRVMYEQLRDTHPELPVVDEARLAALEQSYSPPRFTGQIEHPVAHYPTLIIFGSSLPLVLYGAWLLSKTWTESIDRLFYLSTALQQPQFFIPVFSFVGGTVVLFIIMPPMLRFGGDNTHENSTQYDFVIPSVWASFPSAIFAALCIVVAVLLIIGMVGAFGAVSHTVFLRLAQSWSIAILAPFSVILAFFAVTLPFLWLAQLLRKIEVGRCTNLATIAYDLVELLLHIDGMGSTELLKTNVNQELAETIGSLADRLGQTSWLERSMHSRLHTSQQRISLAASHLRGLAAELDFPSRKSYEIIQTELIGYVSSLVTGFLSELPTPAAPSEESLYYAPAKQPLANARVVASCFLYVGVPLTGLYFALRTLDLSTATALQMPFGFAFTVWLAIGIAHLVRHTKLPSQGLLHDVVRFFSRMYP